MVLLERICSCIPESIYPDEGTRVYSDVREVFVVTEFELELISVVILLSFDTSARVLVFWLCSLLGEEKTLMFPLAAEALENVNAGDGLDAAAEDGEERKEDRG